MTRSFALLGSGEFEPWSEPVTSWLLERSPRPDGVALLSPAAAAHEGEDAFRRWGAKGLEHVAGLDAPAEVLDLRTREDAHRPEVVERVEAASLVYFSGGNPARLAAMLRETPLWTALTAALADGLPFAGCSAGVAFLTQTTFDSDSQDLATIWQPGLGYVRELLFGPHWDIVDTWVPGASEAIVGSVAPGHTFVGLDEETAMLGDGDSWSVAGRQRVHVLRDGVWRSYGAGERFDLPFVLDG